MESWGMVIGSKLELIIIFYTLDFKLFQFFSGCETPQIIEVLQGLEVIDIACGGAHSAAITSSGHLYTWGKGRYGRLGHGDSEDQLKPKRVS